MSAFIAIAHHPYEAGQEDEISFQKDDRIKVTDNSDSDWWVGTLETTGATGLFPSNFVSVEAKEETTTSVKAAEETPITVKTEETEKKKDETEVEEEVKQENDEEEKEEKVPEKKDSIIGMARVMEDYPSQGPGEISLHRGGIINVYEVLDDEWARGELNGKVGKYPSKYIEDIDMPGRPDLGMKTSDASIKKEDNGGFKLAAFGVKQGGIGSLFGGGFPGLKKTNTKPAEPAESKPAAAVPQAPAASVPTVPATTKPVEEPKPIESPVIEEVKPVVKAENAKEILGRAIVLHPYDPLDEDELSLIRGEYIEILNRDGDEGWWEGRNERGETGAFPVSYVKDLGDEPISVPPPTRTRRSVNSPATPTSPSGQLPPIPNNSRPSSINSNNTPANARPVVPTGARPVTIQPSSNTRRVSVPFVPRPNSLNSSNSSSSINKPFTPARPPTVPEQNVLPVANVDQDVASRSMDEPVAAAVGIVEPQVESKEEEVATETEVPDVEEKKIAEEEEEEKFFEPVKEVAENVKSEEEEEKEEPIAVAQVSEKSESIRSPVEEVASRSLDEPIAPVSITEEEVIREAPVEKKEEEEEEEEKEEVVEKKEEEEEKKEEEEMDEPKAEKEKEETEETKAEDEKEIVEEVEEEKPIDLNTMAPTGPKLTAPSRARIGGNRTRRTPTTPSSEPSQTEILQKELEQMPEPEKPAGKPAVSPPPKPVKPIFAKFPTPFATGEDITKHQLKPVTRRPWEVKQEQQEAPAPAPASNNTNDDEAPVRPTGVKNLASRFNFGGVPSGGSNDVLETKLKNHTKNEVEKVRKEFEALLQEERDKRTQLEDKVTVLMERLEALEHK